MRSLRSPAIAGLTLLLTSCTAPAPTTGIARMPEAVLDDKLARWAIVEISFDATALSPEERELLRDLIEVGQLLERAYWEQSHPGAWTTRATLAASDDRLDRKALVLLNLHGGPFDRLQGREPFLGELPRPPGGGLYPPYLTRTELEEFLARRPDRAAALLDPYAVVRWDGEDLVAVPFHEAYAEWIAPAAQRLRDAAARDEETALSRYLLARATAMETDDWTLADADPPGPDGGRLEAILGPYGRGEDRLTGRKATYEAMIGIVDREETRKLDVFLRERDALVRRLPGAPGTVRPASLSVATEIYRGGQSAHGGRPVAVTLPGATGSHTVLWRNRIDARREQVLVPLVTRTLAEDQADLLTPGGYFTLVMMRELGRTLAPLRADDAAGPPEAWAVLEEATAAAVGLHSLTWLLRRGLLPASAAREQHVAHLADLLAALRLDPDSPRGRASALVLNWHREQGGITYDPDTGRWGVDAERMLPSSTALAAALLGIETAIDGNPAIRLMAEYGNVGPAIRATLARAADLPVEVAAEYRVKWE